MPRCHHFHPRLRNNPKRSIPVQRNAHPFWGAVWANFIQFHIVQSDAHRIRCAAIHTHDTPLNRSVIPPSQYRCLKGMGPDCRDRKPDTNQTDKDHQWGQQLMHPTHRDHAKYTTQSDTQIKWGNGFKPKRKIQSNTRRQTDRHPCKHMSALGQKICGDTVDAAHACPRIAHWIDSDKPYIPCGY